MAYLRQGAVAAAMLKNRERHGTRGGSDEDMADLDALDSSERMPSIAMPANQDQLDDMKELRRVLEESLIVTAGKAEVMGIENSLQRWLEEARQKARRAAIQTANEDVDPLHLLGKQSETDIAWYRNEKALQQLRILRDSLQKKQQAKRSYLSLFGFLAFVALFMTIIILQKNPTTAFEVENALIEATFSIPSGTIDPNNELFYDVGTPQDIYKWLSTTLIGGVFVDAACGNGKCEAPDEFAGFERFGCSADCGYFPDITPVSITLEVQAYYVGVSWNVFSHVMGDYVYSEYQSFDKGGNNTFSMSLPDGRYTLSIRDDNMIGGIGGSVLVNNTEVKSWPTFIEEQPYLHCDLRQWPREYFRAFKENFVATCYSNPKETDFSKPCDNIGKGCSQETEFSLYFAQRIQQCLVEGYKYHSPLENNLVYTTGIYLTQLLYLIESCPLVQSSKADFETCEYDLCLDPDQAGICFPGCLSVGCEWGRVSCEGTLKLTYGPTSPESWLFRNKSSPRINITYNDIISYIDAISTPYDEPKDLCNSGVQFGEAYMAQQVNYEGASYEFVLFKGYPGCSSFRGDYETDFEVWKYNKPGTEVRIRDMSQRKQRYVGEKNQLIGGLFINQKRAVEKECPSRYPSSLRCIDLNSANTDPFSVGCRDPVFLQASSLYDSYVDKNAFYNRREMTDGGFPYAFFHSFVNSDGTIYTGVDLSLASPSENSTVEASGATQQYASSTEEQNQGQSQLQQHASKEKEIYSHRFSWGKRLHSKKTTSRMTSITGVLPRPTAIEDADAPKESCLSPKCDTQGYSSTKKTPAGRSLHNMISDEEDEGVFYEGENLEEATVYPEMIEGVMEEEGEQMAPPSNYYPPFPNFGNAEEGEFQETLYNVEEEELHDGGIENYFDFIAYTEFEQRYTQTDKQNPTTTTNESSVAASIATSPSSVLNPFNRTSRAKSEFHHLSGYHIFFDNDLTEEQAKNFLTFLSEGFFMDELTKEVAVRYCTYNYEFGFLTNMEVRWFFEKGGRIKYRHYIQSIPMEPYASTLDMARLVLEGIFVLAVLYSISSEIVDAYQAKKEKGTAWAYFTELGNLFDLFSLGLLVAISVFWVTMLWKSSAIDVNPNFDVYRYLGNFSRPQTEFARTSLTPARFFEYDATNHERAIAFFDKVIELAMFNEIYVVLCGISILLLIARILKAMHFQARMGLLTRTLSEASTDLLHFVVLFMIIFTGFSVMAYTLFGHQLREFMTLGESMLTCFEMLVGNYEIGRQLDYVGSSPMAGIIFYWTYFFIVFLILINILLAILVDAFADVKNKAQDTTTMLSEVLSILSSARKGSASKFVSDAKLLRYISVRLDALEAKRSNLSSSKKKVVPVSDEGETAVPVEGGKEDDRKRRVDVELLKEYLKPFEGEEPPSEEKEGFRVLRDAEYVHAVAQNVVARHNVVVEEKADLSIKDAMRLLEIERLIGGFGTTIDTNANNNNNTNNTNRSRSRSRNNNGSNNRDSDSAAAVSTAKRAEVFAMSARKTEGGGTRSETTGPAGDQPAREQMQDLRVKLQQLTTSYVNDIIKTINDGQLRYNDS